jgi:hypothetical protein
MQVMPTRADLDIKLQRQTRTGDVVMTITIFNCPDIQGFPQ